MQSWRTDTSWFSGHSHEFTFLSVKLQHPHASGIVNTVPSTTFSVSTRISGTWVVPSCAGMAYGQARHVQIIVCSIPVSVGCK